MSGIEKDIRVRLVNPPGRMVPYGAEGTAESAPSSAGLFWAEFPQGRMHTRVSEVEVIGDPPGDPVTRGIPGIEIGVRRSLAVVGRDICAAVWAARRSRKTAYLVADGERIAVIVPLPAPVPPGLSPGGQPWTDATAIGHLQSGERNTPQFVEALDFIESRLQGCDPGLANARVDDPYGPEPGDGDLGEQDPESVVDGPGCPVRDLDAFEDEPEPAEYDPGPEIDDQGGMSEFTPGHPDAYPGGRNAGESDHDR